MQVFDPSLFDPGIQYLELLCTLIRIKSKTVKDQVTVRIVVADILFQHFCMIWCSTFLLPFAGRLFSAALCRRIQEIRILDQHDPVFAEQ